MAAQDDLSKAGDASSHQGTDSPCCSKAESTKLGKAIRHPYVTIALWIVGGISGLTTLWLGYHATLGAAILSYELKSASSTIWLENANPVLRFDSEVSLENTGSRSLPSEAFTENIPGFGKGLLLKCSNDKSRILGCIVTKMHPSERAAAEVRVLPDGHNVFIKAIPLNPGEGFSIRLISSNDPNTISVWGHLAGCKIEKTASPFDLKAILGMVWNCFVALGCTLGIVSFGIIVFVYFFAQELIKEILKGIGSIVGKVSSWIRKVTFGWIVREKAKDPEKAMEILLSVEGFSKFAEDVNADTAEKRDKLREHLSEFAASNNQSTVVVSPIDPNINAINTTGPK